MKTKLLIIFLLLNNSFVFAQLTPRWEMLYNGFSSLIDSTSEKDSYIYNQHLTSNDKNCLFQVDSNHYYRIVVEAFRKFPKDGEYFNQGFDIKQFPNIEFTEDGGRSWKKIYSFQYMIMIEPKIYTYIYLDIKYANDSLVIFTGNTENSTFIAVIKRSPNLDETWNLEYLQTWETPNVVIVDLAMINELIGYAIYANPLENGKNKIIYTNDGWKTFVTLYEPTELPSPSFSKLSLCKQDNETLISCVYDAKNMLYLSKNNFKNLQIIDFNPNHKLIQIYAYKPDIIYVLTEGNEKDESNNKYVSRRLHKTTNGGNTWDVIKKSNRDERIFNFKLYDENNFIFSGIFHPNEPSAKSNFLRTQNGGKFFEYLYGPKIENSDYVLNYHYINDSQIIVAKVINNFEYPVYNHDFSYLRQIIENFNIISGAFDKKISYFQSLTDNTLKPPIIKLDDSLTSKHNFGSDTLYWKKVNGAENYKITYYGVADASIPWGIGGSNYWTYTRMTTERIDTTVKDTFLILNGLKRNYNYEIWVSAENKNQTSELGFLLTSCKEAPKMKYPIINYPMRDDTIPYGKVTFSWEKIDNADSYNITLFNVDKKMLDSAKVTGFNFDTKYILMERNHENNSLIYNDLLPNSNYYITVTAMNNDEISNYYWLAFVTGNYPSSIQENFDISNSFISPNLATDHITLNIPPLEKRGLGGVLLEIRIFDIFGNEMQTTPALRATPPLQGGEIRIDISALPTGIYFLKIDNEKPIKFVKVE